VTLHLLKLEQCRLRSSFLLHTRTLIHAHIPLHTCDTLHACDSIYISRPKNARDAGGMYCLLGLWLVCYITGVSCLDCQENAGEVPDWPGACACLLGFEIGGSWPFSTCDACPKGKFTYARGVDECDDCPAGATTAGTASPTALHCVCDAGYNGDFAGTACAACPKSTYKTAAGAQGCLSCRGGAVPGVVPGRGMALIMQNPPRLASATSWSTAQSEGVLPTYDSSAGPTTGQGAVVFDSTENQCIQGGTQTFNISSRGFTLVALVMFTGDMSLWSYVLDLGNSQNQILLARKGGTTRMMFSIVDTVSSWNECTVLSRLNSVVRDKWLQIVAMYTPETGWGGDSYVSISVDGHEREEITCSFPRGDRTVLSSLVSSPVDYPTIHFNGKISGLFAVDALLSSETITQLFVDMPQGLDPVSACVTCALSDACVTCATGKTSNTTANTDPAGCGLCQSNSNLDTGEGVCLCDEGYSGPSCVPCAKGTFKTGHGPMVCENCPEGQYSSAEASASCSLCQTSLTTVDVGSTSQHDCVCIAGFSMFPPADSGSCSACAAGKFKIAAGDAACTNCVAGQYSVALGAISDVCQSCPSNSNAAEASGRQTDCTCNSGYTGDDGGNCSACAAGKYKTGTGDALCTNCVAGQYSVALGATSDVCQTCPSNSDAAEASDSQTDCTCNPGYTGDDGGSCRACVAGTYKISMGDAACTNCVVGQYSVVMGAISNVCQPCPSGSDAAEASDSQADCTCNSGYTRDGSVCRACVAGKYKIATGDALCTNCVAGQYSEELAASSNVCQTCPSNSDAAEASYSRVDCTCNSGYIGYNGGNCDACVPGKYKIATGDAMCTNCVAGQYSVELAAISDVCQTCPSNSHADEASSSPTDCTCNSGYTGDDGGSCNSCVAGKYKIATGDALCTNCVAGQYSVALGATSDVCQTCPSNSGAAEASGSPADCKCNSGYTGGDSGSCIACVAGKYKNATGAMPCTACLTDQYSTAIGAMFDVCQSCPLNGYALSVDNITKTARQMCPIPSETIRLHAGINTNVTFAIQRIDPCTVRFLLSSVKNWTIGDKIRVYHGGHAALNPTVLWAVQISTLEHGSGAQSRWSPVNVQPMHRKHSAYRITVESGPLFLRLDSYERSGSVESV